MKNSEEAKTYTVYMHVAPSGKRYIGITCRKPENRWNGGRAYVGSPHFYNTIMKYGWENIDHLILFENLSKDEAIQKEKKLIEILETTNPAKGYNITKGGEGACGIKQSDETRSKRSSAMKKKMLDQSERKIIMANLSMAHSTQEIRDKRSKAIKVAYQNPDLIKKVSESRMGTKNHFYGKSHTEETRAIIMEKRAQQVMKNGKPILQLDASGAIVGRFESGAQAQRTTGVDNRNINACARGKIKSAGGFGWHYMEVS